MKRAGCITLSWDDGHPLDLRIADLMVKHGLRGTFYIPRTAQRTTVDVAGIRQLGMAFEVGAHTLRHVALTSLSDEHARDEISGAKRWLEDVTGQTCNLFCPPAGRFAARHLQMIGEARYRAVRTVELLSLDRPRPRGRLLLMPTTVQAWTHGSRAYLQNVTKRLAVRNLWRFMLHGPGIDWADLSRVLVGETLRCGGVFHLWAHSWEIDASNAWRRLDDVMRFLGDHIQEMPPLTNGEVCEMQDGLAASAARMQRVV